MKMPKYLRSLANGREYPLSVITEQLLESNRGPIRKLHDLFTL